LTYQGQIPCSESDKGVLLSASMICPVAVALKTENCRLLAGS